MEKVCKRRGRKFRDTEQSREEKRREENQEVCGWSARFFTERCTNSFYPFSVFHPSQPERHDLVLSARPLTRSAFVTEARPACSPLSTNHPRPSYLSPFSSSSFLLSLRVRRGLARASSGPRLDRARESRPLRGDTQRGAQSASSLF